MVSPTEPQVNPHKIHKLSALPGDSVSEGRTLLDSLFPPGHSECEWDDESPSCWKVEELGMAEGASLTGLGTVFSLRRH